MSLRGWLNKYLDGLRGAWNTSVKVEDQPARAFTCENSKFFQGRVTTRDGFIPTGITSTAKVPMMYNWLAAALNKLIYQDGMVVKLRDLASSTTSDLFTIPAGGRAFSVAEAGIYIYFAAYDMNGLGVMGVKISSTALAGTPPDNAFAPPPFIVPVITQVGAGQCTVGTHNFGYIITTRTGFITLPGPATLGNVLSPVAFTITSGMGPSTLNMAITAPAGVGFPSDWNGGTASVIMTRTDNPSKWFYVPKAIVSLPGGPATGGSPGPPVVPPFTVNCTFSFSDEDLANLGEEVTDFKFISQDNSGNPPIKPSVVCAYGARMVYVENYNLWISDISAFQQLDPSLNLLQSPSEKSIATCFPMRGLLYFCGEHWTFSLSDNSLPPTEWAAPQEVSGAIGTRAPYGVAWRTGGDYAWVASESGLYLFTGQYAQIPISYKNSNLWNRINWNVEVEIIVKDYPLLHQVWVLAPLDGATEPTHILVWDYSNTMDHETVDFSLYYRTDVTNFCSIAIIQDPNNSRSSMWLGPAAAAPILKQSYGDAGIPGNTSDNGASIHTVWESGYILTSAEKPSKVNRFWAYFFSVRGNGNLQITIYNKDRTRNVVTTPIALSTAPGKEPERKAEMQSENISIRIETGATVPGEWFDISDINVYWKPWVTNR